MERRRGAAALPRRARAAAAALLVASAVAAGRACLERGGFWGGFWGGLDTRLPQGFFGTRLFLGASPGEMVVAWCTAAPLPLGPPCVSFWRLGARAAAPAGERAPPPPPRAATACGASAPYFDPGSPGAPPVLHEHRVALAGLARGARYAYAPLPQRQVPDGAGGGGGGAPAQPPPRAWSFRVPPARASAADPLRALLVGDTGVAAWDTLPLMAADAGAAAAAGRPYAALLHAGDHAYDLHHARGRRAAQYLAALEPLAARAPLVAVQGNHDAAWNFSAFNALLAGAGGFGARALSSSADLGPLHVLRYSTEALFWPQLFGEDAVGRMVAGMDADLAAADANRGAAPWVLALGHRPMYCAAPSAAAGRCSEEHEASRRGVPSACPRDNPAACRPVAPGGREWGVEELLLRHRVDVAAYGHDHSYVRTRPVFNYSAVAPPQPLELAPREPPGGPPAEAAYASPAAPVHVTSGAGGNREMRRRRAGAPPPPRGPCGGARAPWCAFQSGAARRGAPRGAPSDWSYSRIEVHNATHLRWEQVSTQGGVVDEWWIVKGEEAPAPAAAARVDRA